MPHNPVNVNEAYIRASQLNTENKLNNTINGIIDLERRITDLERVVERDHNLERNRKGSLSCCKNFVTVMAILVISYHAVFTFGMNFQSVRLAGF
jgi:hypothetical protein